MQSYCYNEITINGEMEELGKLHKLLTEANYGQRNMDFMYVLGLNGKATFETLRREIDTGWFYPLFEFSDSTITMNGNSSLAPPVLFLIKLVDKFPSLHIVLYSEAYLCQTGYHVVVSKDGVKTKFAGCLLEFRAYCHK